MMDALPSARGNWTLPSHPVTLTSTLPNYEESLPLRVNRDGVKNYLKNRGTLTLGDWQTESRRTSISAAAGQRLPSEHYAFVAPPPKVLGHDALRNYTRSRSSAPNLIGGVVDPPHPHHNHRVKPEAQANYNRNHNTQMKVLMEKYGKLEPPEPPRPHTQGQVNISIEFIFFKISIDSFQLATNLFHIHKEGHLSKVFQEYGNVTPVTPPHPHVKGIAAEMNLRRNQGASHILEHNTKFREPIPDPHVKGEQAHLNYTVAQGCAVNQLFHEYGKLPVTARTEPKVKYGGIQNFRRAQGDAMRKTLSQCPPSHRFLERPQSALM